jgi:hypothetical protein
MNTSVSFEIAKLLKEKGFEMIAGSCYYNEEFFINQNLIPLQYPELKGEGYKERVSDKIVFTPIIAEVVMWLYEKYGIWIQVTINTTWVGKKGEYGAKFSSEVISQNRNLKVKSLIFRKIRIKPYNSPREAYEAAIEYCLKELICIK